MVPSVMIVHPPHARRSEDGVYLASRIENFAPADALWYAVPAEYGEELALAGADAFVLGVLSGAMEAGQDIVVRGSLSERLYYNLTRYYMPMLSKVRPTLRPVRILPDDLSVRQPSASQAVGVGFSGGIDSFSTLADHFDQAAPPGYRATHLIMSNVGSHGLGTIAREHFKRRLGRLSHMAAELELPLIPVDSNLHDFVSGRFRRSHTLRTLSAAHVLQGLVGKYLFASTYTYADTHAQPYPDIAIIDAMAVHLLSTETTECILVGSQHGRVEKTELVADFPASYRFLDVCIAPNAGADGERPNCSRCYKCARTMLTLELLGKLDLYGAVFDLDYWHRHRTRQIAAVLGRRIDGHRSMLVKEITDLANRRQGGFPLSARLLGEVHGLARSGPQAAWGRRLVRTFRRHAPRPSASPTPGGTGEGPSPT